VIPVQQANPSSALVASLGLKGRVRLQVDEVILGTIILEDTVNSPYSADRLVIASNRQASAGVGVFSGIGIRPGAGLILRIDQITVIASASALLPWLVHVLGPVALASVTIVASPDAVNRNSELGRATNTPQSNSELLRITNGSTPGSLIHRESTASDLTSTWDIPGGYYLYGDDPAGVSAMVIWNSVADSELTVSWLGREFRNKG